MALIVVVRSPEDWPLDIPEIEIVSSRDYLTKPEWTERRNIKLFNLARDYRYQSSGYYVSLLAEARGHRPLPSVPTIVDLQSPSLVRLISEDLDKLIQQNLSVLQSEEFDLSIYFGKNMALRYNRLARELYNLFPAPMLRAKFSFKDKWLLKSISAISGKDVKPGHEEFVLTAAKEYFSKKRAYTGKRKTAPKYYLAVLIDEANQDPPSNKQALDHFSKAAAKKGIAVEIIGKDDYGHLAEFDALFIRETTRVNHYTYRFARKAEAEGLVVIDDPKSILRCTNKVYLEQLLNRHNLRTPSTKVVHRSMIDKTIAELKYPCIIKQPDSYFSQGVFKLEDSTQAQMRLKNLFEKSDLLIIQEFLPTPFDWRVGVLDGDVLFVCKYFMAHKHWQIVKETKNHQHRYGKVETIAAADAPKAIINAALKASSLIGNGLYGVDLKEIDGKAYIVEVNDNPNIDAGYEDKVVGDLLYDQLIDVFLKRLESRNE